MDVNKTIVFRNSVVFAFRWFAVFDLLLFDNKAKFWEARIWQVKGVGIFWLLDKGRMLGFFVEFGIFDEIFN
jgi:hypothetical protein